jgi:hypothetical protein
MEREQVPGFVPRVLTDVLSGDGIALLRADARVFDAMLDGWRAQMMARGLTTPVIQNSCRMVARFQDFTMITRGPGRRTMLMSTWRRCDPGIDP